MKKENYLNFDAFRKALYDIKLSERARLVYIHLLQKSSSKGCKNDALYNDVELTKELIAIDLGILTKNDEPSTKLVQRALEELEDEGYIKRFQKYKSKGCPLTIRLNFSKQFLSKNGTKKESSFDKSENKNDSSFSKTESGFVHHYNPSLSSSNPSLNLSNPSLSHLISSEDNKKRFKTECNVDFEEALKSTEENKTVSNDFFNDFKNKVDSNLAGENEDELLDRKNELSSELSKNRVAIGSSTYSRCNLYLNRKFNEVKESVVSVA